MYIRKIAWLLVALHLCFYGTIIQPLSGQQHEEKQMESMSHHPLSPSTVMGLHKSDSRGPLAWDGDFRLIKNLKYNPNIDDPDGWNISSIFKPWVIGSRSTRLIKSLETQTDTHIKLTFRP